MDSAVTDQQKISKIWLTIGVEGIEGTFCRLGVSGNTGGGSPCRNRPILFTLADKSQRSLILDNTNRLKNLGDNYKKICVKKDIHPSVRKEWRRLRDAEAIEKARLENVGCAICLDTHECKLYRDAIVIDSWDPHFF